MVISFRSYRDLLQQGITMEEIMSRLKDIDIENNLLEEDGELIERYIPFYEQTEVMWRLVLADDCIIGYWSFAMLNAAYIARIAAGQLRENDVNYLALKTDMYSGIGDLLFDSICLAKSHQKQKLSGLVMKSMHDTFRTYGERGIHVDTVWASIWSVEGAHFCERLGFKSHIRNKYTGVIYRVSFSEFVRKLEQVISTYGL